MRAFSVSDPVSGLSVIPTSHGRHRFAMHPTGGAVVLGHGRDIGAMVSARALGQHHGAGNGERDQAEKPDAEQLAFHQTDLKRNWYTFVSPVRWY